jgi:hypothetical protein
LREFTRSARDSFFGGKLTSPNALLFRLHPERILAKVTEFRK